MNDLKNYEQIIEDLNENIYLYSCMF